MVSLKSHVPREIITRRITLDPADYERLDQAVMQQLTEIGYRNIRLRHIEVKHGAWSEYVVEATAALDCASAFAQKHYFEA